MTAGDRIGEYRGQHATHEGHRCRDALTPSAVPSNEIHPDAILCLAHVRLEVLQTLLHPLPTTQRMRRRGRYGKVIDTHRMASCRVSCTLRSAPSAAQGCRGRE